MTVRELTNVYFLGKYTIYYYDDSKSDGAIDIDPKEFLSDKVLDLKVRAFSPCEVLHGIMILVEKPSWV